MQKYNFGTLNEFLGGWKSNTDYFAMLGRLSQLSRLFSESNIPYLDYRLAENVFCRYFTAINDARSCTAYDARINKIGIGIKTFTIPSGSSMEKIAEFNKLKTQLTGLQGIDLAIRLGQFRNDRMRMANDAFDVTETQYHIVGRMPGLLRIFNVPYEEVQLDKISHVKDTDTSITFDDGINEYSFNKSKSVLQKKFYLPEDYKEVEVSILDDPFKLIEGLFVETEKVKQPEEVKQISEVLVNKNKTLAKGIDYVILPLYSVRDKCVPIASGLNQWNANGRERHEDEVYIPVPAAIHNNYPDFFPQTREETFTIILPNGKRLSAKMCQSGLKGLMSNPNRELGNWILRKVLKKKPGELVTMDDLDRYGIDSVFVSRHENDADGKRVYSITFNNDYESYENFIE